MPGQHCYSWRRDRYIPAPSKSRGRSSIASGAIYNPACIGNHHIRRSGIRTGQSSTSRTRRGDCRLRARPARTDRDKECWRRQERRRQGWWWTGSSFLSFDGSRSNSENFEDPLRRLRCWQKAWMLDVWWYWMMMKKKKQRRINWTWEIRALLIDIDEGFEQDVIVEP